MKESYEEYALLLVEGLGVRGIGELNIRIVVDVELSKAVDRVYVYLMVLFEMINLVSGNLEIVVSGDIQNV